MDAEIRAVERVRYRVFVCQIAAIHGYPAFALQLRRLRRIAPETAHGVARIQHLAHRVAAEKTRCACD